MTHPALISIDLAKNVFQLHGVDHSGKVLFRKRLRRSEMHQYFAKIDATSVAMEACATSHYWARELRCAGHHVRLIAPQFVKPFVKRQKNDMADAEAIAEAAQRPTMRFVPVKTEDQQRRAIIFRSRDLFVRQRTQLINALRAHLAEFGAVAPKGAAQLARLRSVLKTPDNGLPEDVVEMGELYLEHIANLSDRIDELTLRLHEESKANEQLRRLQTMPGVGPITAVALESFAPDLTTFHRGRDFAAWLGLVPNQHSSGGKQRLGRTSKMGQRDIRRLLISGAMAVVQWAGRRGHASDPWLTRMLVKKPRMLVAIALANRMARCLWAMTVKKEEFRQPHQLAS